MSNLKFRAFDQVNKAFYDNQDELLDNLGNFMKNPRFTITQFTGLLDKSGKEIYEGDILDVDDKLGSVVFDMYTDAETYADIDHLGWMVEIKDSDRSTLPDASRRGLVVGNIYEQPNLLVL